MKPRIADALKRLARALTRLAIRIDQPSVAVYDDQWNKLGGLPRGTTISGGGA